MSFQAIQSMSSTSDSLPTTTDVSDSQEELELILAVRGGLTEDEALYFREVKGLQVDDKFVR
jgi:hypothetical protein